MREAYERGETDEFIAPTTVKTRRIRPGDSVIAFNFRPDRMRQITEKLTETVDRYVTMTEYDEDWAYPILFPPQRPAITLAKVISDCGLKQPRRGGDGEVPARDVLLQRRREDPYEGEVRELVPSPRDVPTYDHKPEMSAREAAWTRSSSTGSRISRRSRSSTSRTRTWSATPATSTRR